MPVSAGAASVGGAVASAHGHPAPPLYDSPTPSTQATHPATQWQAAEEALLQDPSILPGSQWPPARPEESLRHRALAVIRDYLSLVPVRRQF
ncbi:hypothetical protein Hamer_G008058 [Homarus americanus]|uniref:Uncharacterized protein n=1 Tax=Homarus americanus TaxID=6706 RepID=A0A8J5JZW8_HOMAM|nr:hypothetical protein Hamer_G008058 [Homarus americanus]